MVFWYAFSMTRGWTGVDGSKYDLHSFLWNPSILLSLLVRVECALRMMRLVDPSFPKMSPFSLMRVESVSILVRLVNPSFLKGITLSSDACWKCVNIGAIGRSFLPQRRHLLFSKKTSQSPLSKTFFFLLPLTATFYFKKKTPCTNPSKWHPLRRKLSFYRSLQNDTLSRHQNLSLSSQNASLVIPQKKFSRNPVFLKKNP